MKSRRFIDATTIYVRGGRGGNGCLSFRREKYVPKGGPDGGDGGHGGQVILEASRDVVSLERLLYTAHQYAEDAGHGRGKQSHGRNGKELLVGVPCGTEVWNVETGTLLGDLVEHGARLLVARGGKGGLGNCHWKTATHQTPREHTDGEPGDELALRLELKLVADCGLVGFPNAGKSSLLTRISDAHPKVGAYPFTTLNPVIGTLIFEDYSRMTIADLPGLIEGAHAGTGLGHAFLRHMERSPCFLYVIDMAGVDGREPWDDYEKLRTELGLYRDGMTDRPSQVVATKMDLPGAADHLDTFVSRTGVSPFPVSAETGAGLHELKDALNGLYRDVARQPASGPEGP